MNIQNMRRQRLLAAAAMTVALWAAPTQALGAAELQISADGGHTCALRSDGSAVCWGLDDHGQAGSPAGTNYAQISAGLYHTCALRSDGGAVCWGDNADGQATVPAGSYTQISAGGEHTCAIRSDGAIVCWGENSAAQATAPAGSYTQISAAASHTCALRSDGGIVCWGSNSYGQAAVPGSGAAVSPGSLAFAEQPRATVSGPQEVRIVNTGVNLLEVTGARFTGAAAGDFLISASTCDAGVRAGASCSLWVRFAPQEEGARSATLLLDSNASADPHAVALSGTGAAPATAPAVVPPPPLASDDLLSTLTAPRSVRLGTLRRRGLRSRTSLLRSGLTVRARLTLRRNGRTVTLGSATVRGRPAGALGITVRLTRKGRRALKRARRARATLKVTAATASGLSQSRTARIRLLR